MPNNRRLLAKLVTTFADGVCHMGSMMDPCGRILGFLDWSHYCTNKAEYCVNTVVLSRRGEVRSASCSGHFTARPC
jgi:hypothetical protein